MSRVYFAAPLFCAAEWEFNAKLVAVLERHGYEVFLPQRDGVVAATLEGKSEQEACETVFRKDTEALRAADILCIVLDGRVPDEGACAELGMAYALGKRCYGLRTDMRALETGLSVNPLIAGCCRVIWQQPTTEALCAALDAYLTAHTL